MPIPKGYKANFETLLKAAKNGDLALVECQDKKTKKKVYVACAIASDEKKFVVVPFAKMFDGNPYEELNPPDPDNPKNFLEN